MMRMPTEIEWTDETWNPLAGCTPVSPGCANCYAARMAKRQIAMGNKNYAGTVDKHGRWTGKINLIPDALEKPFHWRKPRRVFVNSMSDLFHESVPDQFIYDVLLVIRRCPQHTFLILTKRPQQRMRNILLLVTESRFLPNLHLGVSVEDQATANERIPWLLKTPAAVRWVSLEPMLGPVDLRPWLGESCYYHSCPGMLEPIVSSDGSCWERSRCRHCARSWFNDPPRRLDEMSGPYIDGVVVGGESGPGARPMDIEWVRSVRDQCQEVGVAFFFKQMMVNGKKIAMPKLDGRTWDEWLTESLPAETAEQTPSGPGPE